MKSQKLSSLYKVQFEKKFDCKADLIICQIIFEMILERV